MKKATCVCQSFVVYTLGWPNSTGIQSFCPHLFYSFSPETTITWFSRGLDHNPFLQKLIRTAPFLICRCKTIHCILLTQGQTLSACAVWLIPDSDGEVYWLEYHIFRSLLFEFSIINTFILFSVWFWKFLCFSTYSESHAPKEEISKSLFCYC